MVELARAAAVEVSAKRRSRLGLRPDASLAKVLQAEQQLAVSDDDEDDHDDNDDEDVYSNTACL